MGRGFLSMVEAHQDRFGLGHQLPCRFHAVLHFDAFVTHLAYFAQDGWGVAKLQGAQVVDVVVGHQHADLVPIPRLAHHLPPPMNPGLLEVNQVHGVVDDAVSIHVGETNFRGVRLWRLCHGGSRR